MKLSSKELKKYKEIKLVTAFGELKLNKTQINQIIREYEYVLACERDDKSIIIWGE